jgi:uncharacterized protein YggE
MKRLSVVTAAALVLAALAVAAAILRPSAAHGAATRPGTVTTTGHGSVRVVPDEAQVSAGVQTQASTAAAALGDNATRMRAVLAALRRAGGRELQTEEVSLWPQTNGDGVVTGYVANDSVSATAAVARAGALVDAAVHAGANTVGGPTLSVSGRSALYREALRKAVADARAKAEALAVAGGRTVGLPVRIAESSSAPVLPFAHAAFASAQAASTPVEPGTQDVTADVTVTFAAR